MRPCQAGIPHDGLLNTRSKIQTAYVAFTILLEKGLLRPLRDIEALS
jgi:hypothetical protein